MCCIQVVPLLGNEATKTSPSRSGSAAHRATVRSDVIGSNGMGSSPLARAQVAVSASVPPSAAAATSFRASLTSSATSYQSLPHISRHFLRMPVKLDESDSTTRLRPPEPRDCRHRASHTVATETAATAPRATSSRVVGMAAAHDQMRNGPAESETLSRSRPTLGLEAAVAHRRGTSARAGAERREGCSCESRKLSRNTRKLLKRAPRRV